MGGETEMGGETLETGRVNGKRASCSAVRHTEWENGI